jgi:hypothetical protein
MDVGFYAKSPVLQRWKDKALPTGISYGWGDRTEEGGIVLSLLRIILQVKFF